MSDELKTVRVQFAGYVDLPVDDASNAALISLSRNVAEDVQHAVEHSALWGYSPLLVSLGLHPKQTVKVLPVLNRNESVEARLAELLTKVKQWEDVDGEWVGFRDQYRDEHGDETDSEALDRKILGEYFQKFWDAGDEVKSAAARLLSTLTPLKHEN